MAVLTSSRIKDVKATERPLLSTPRIAPALDELRKALEQTYGFRWPA